MNSDIVLTALELTDDLSGILKGILEKLNKLDTIERAVKKIEGSLVKLEERKTKLEALEKTAREDIDNLKANHAIIEDALDKKIKGLDGKIAELADKERKISQTLDDLNTKDLYLDVYSRLENIKFNKIKESSMHPNESENTEEVLRFFLEKQLGYHPSFGKEERRWRCAAYSSKISSFQGLRRDPRLELSS